MEEVSGIGDGLGRTSSEVGRKLPGGQIDFLALRVHWPFCTMTSAGLPLNVDTWAWVS